MSFRRPRYERGPQVDTVAGSGAPCARAASLIGITVGNEVGRERGRQRETQSRGVADVPKNPLHQVPVSVARSVHVEAHLLDGIPHVRSSERQVLKRANDGAIIRRIWRGQAVEHRDGDGAPKASFLFMKTPPWDFGWMAEAVVWVVGCRCIFSFGPVRQLAVCVWSCRRRWRFRWFASRMRWPCLRFAPWHQVGPVHSCLGVSNSTCRWRRLSIQGERAGGALFGCGDGRGHNNGWPHGS